jgi:hypothetical protein
MPHGMPAGASLQSYLLPLGIALIVIVARNLRPRRLRIERLWIGPAIYLVLMVSALSATPPPVTPVSIGLLVLGFVLGAGLGWQRGRLTRIDIHPETHDLTSRASVFGLILIFAILALRSGLRLISADEAGVIGVPIVAVADAVLVLGVATIATQRLELWLRARRMLEEARAGSGPPKIVG